jgi:hypothetical protein
MGAADRSLLAKLGFADPDKRSPLHDLACQYVAQPAIADSIGLTVTEAGIASDLKFEASKCAQFECPISKGEGQYKTTVGFVDVILPMGYAREHRWRPVPVFVEVKIAPVGLGEILRQIRLYEEYTGGQFWLLLAGFELPDSLVRGLLDASVHPVQLGPNFRNWAAAQRAAPRATNVKVI